MAENSFAIFTLIEESLGQSTWRKCTVCMNRRENKINVVRALEPEYWNSQDPDGIWNGVCGMWDVPSAHKPSI